MCTLVVDHSPDADPPVLIVAVRDEMLDRTWAPPARHWPDHPDLIGGRDLRAGGTWLAVNLVTRRLGCVLNARGEMAPPPARHSRGELPLAAADGPLEGLEPARYDPFHLVFGDTTGLKLLSWDGRQLQERCLEPGVHVVVNTGLSQTLEDPESRRAGRFAPLFAAAPRPCPRPGEPPERAWESWLRLVDGDGLALDDPEALIVRRRNEAGLYGSTSTTLLAVSSHGVRYDFSDQPGQGRWRNILPG